jgi:hypothetical protein
VVGRTLPPSGMQPMTLAATHCAICALERVLLARTKDQRAELVTLDPRRDRRYGQLFHVLVGVDRDLRMLKGRVRER